MKLVYDISSLLPYINWPYFYFAWQVKDPLEKSRLRQEAETLLSDLEGKYFAYGLFELYDAHSSGDDIVICSGAREQESVSSSPPKLGGEPEGRGGLNNRSFSPPKFFSEQSGKSERGGLPEGRGGLKEPSSAMGGLRSAVNQGDRSFDSSRQTKSKTCPLDLPLDFHIPCLRQQQGTPPYLCLSDFLAPDGNHNVPLDLKDACHHRDARTFNVPLGRRTLATNGTQECSMFNVHRSIGLFATSVSPSLETDFSSDPYLKLMTQLLADRLAEAAAERMHEQVRKEFWGYAADENLSIPDMLVEKFQGIRPAVGYPSLPDTSLNFIIDDLIDMKQIGIRLTESGAMKPHASVSGLMLAHPEARYFSVGKIGEDQLRDYASRRGLPLELMRRFLASNL